MKLIKNLFAALILITVAATSCQKETIQPLSDDNKTIIQQFSETGQINMRSVSGSYQTVSFTNSSGLTLTGKLVVPDNMNPAQTYPAMVVLHGCGGLWDNDKPANGMKTSFNEWAHDFKLRGVVALFIDSYTPRTLVEFCDKNPSNDSICSPAHERPRDAYAGLAFLKTLSYVDGSRIGVMGFSHGASTALAAIVDSNYVAKPSWKVSYQSVDYTVPAPVGAPATGGFKTAIAYYPGAGFYSYFGDPYNEKSGKYLNYAPTLILGAELDNLMPATRGLVKKAKYNGAGDSIELVEYEDAKHSFDEAKNGIRATPDYIAKQSARSKVWDWLDTNL